MSRAKTCNSQDIFLSKETKEARTFDTQRREGPGKGGLRSWGEAEDGGLRGWGGNADNDRGRHGPPPSRGKGGLRGWEDDHYGAPKGKSKGGPRYWEDGFAAGFAAAMGKGKAYDARDTYSMRGADRSRSPPSGRWSHDLWVNDRGSSKGSSKGFSPYASFGSPGKGSKNGGKGWKDGKDSKGGKKGAEGGKGKGRGEDPPDATKLDRDLDRYFGKESSTSAKGGKAPKDTASANELDSQLNAYFGEAKSVPGGEKKMEVERKEAEVKADVDEKKDEKKDGEATNAEEKPAATTGTS